ncbi:MAG: pyridoxal-phosphate dependent enzyme [Kofleriaceae bacterium]|nr:pyridoxal-phosphate dependent enzyme [Kofleriaceae bacterium]
MEPVEQALAATEPKRIPLANLPTPLHPLRFTVAGAGFWLKRDDFTGGELAGNKVRKLEYLVAEAKAQGATVLITCGGEQSNHARATAAAAARLGLRCHLVLRTVEPAAPPPLVGNLLIDMLVGAEVSWISHLQWKQRDQQMTDVAARLTAAGELPYIIPVGGSNALGSWGYIRAIHELTSDLERAGLLAAVGAAPRPLTLAYACGSGGTAAGLIIGAKMLGLAARGVRVVGVNVSDDRAYFVAEISRICHDFAAQFEVGVTISPDDIEICDGYVGAGYAKSRPDELATIRSLARTDGVVLDPVYTGKAFHGVVTELTHNPARFGPAGTPVVFIHTGGLFGAFASEMLAASAVR